MTWAPGEHVWPVNSRGDELRVQVWHDANGHEIEGFSIQFVAVIDGDLRPVVRYDTSHGAEPHRDMLNWDGSTFKQDPMRDGISRAQAFTEALDDLDQHVDRYLEDFLRRRP